MMFDESFMDQLKSYNDIVSLFSSYASLKKQGRNYSCLCPFHSERTPSCTVFPDTQSFYCFGCGAGGDAITFIMKIENLEYMEAVRFLAQRAGISMPENSFDDKISAQKTKILEINRETARFFHAQLKTDAGKQALSYLTDRGLTEKSITKYGIGFAPNSWDSLRKHLKNSGYSDDDMIAAKVEVMGKSGSCFDFFRNRIMFPVIDRRGNVIAFGGRRINEQDNPKYINTSDTLVFKKSKNLFSLNFAKNETQKTLILAEGYMDVISIFQAGFHNVVATLGTALTNEQARLMSQYAEEIIIAYDSDGPGQAATKRAIAMLDEVGVTTKIIKMQGAKDPDEFIKKYGATRFKLLLENADNALNFELEKAKTDIDISSEEGKIEYIKRTIPILAAINNKIELDIYISKTADLLGVKREAVEIQVNYAKKNLAKKKSSGDVQNLLKSARHTKDSINPDSVKFPAEAKAEEAIIAFLFRNNDALNAVLQKLSPEDFVTAFNKKVFYEIINILNTPKALSISSFGNEFSPDEMGRISGIVAKYKDVGNSPQLLNDYINTLLLHKDKVAAKNAASLSNDELLNLQNKIKNSKN